MADDIGQAAASGLEQQPNDGWRYGAKAAEAQEDVAQLEGTALLAAAPGEEILDAVFMHFARRRYRKRDDGVAIAKVTLPPGEIQLALEAFMAEIAEDP
jgi:hypothetical protein